MLQEISLSDARKRLSSLLREIEADPDAGYRILVRRRVVAELRSPAPARRKNAGAAMLKLASEMEKLSSQAGGETERVTAANYKEFLYGNKPFTRSRRGR
jgi:antitoxin (DNA-binding transcriptional repressor) of toxin-antitoxin stability system